jgi:uncharacterized protein YbbK (DUF523 family)
MDDSAVNEELLSKIDSFIQELKEMGMPDIVFAAASPEGGIAVKYDGEPRAILYLVRTLDLNIMFDSMQQMAMEVSILGREDNS